MFYTKDGALALSRVKPSNVEYVDIRSGALILKPHEVPDFTQREPFLLTGGSTQTDLEIIQETREARAKDIARAIAEGREIKKPRKPRSSTARIPKKLQKHTDTLNDDEKKIVMEMMKKMSL